MDHVLLRENSKFSYRKEHISLFVLQDLANQRTTLTLFYSEAFYMSREDFILFGGNTSTLLKEFPPRKISNEMFNVILKIK